MLMTLSCWATCHLTSDLCPAVLHLQHKLRRHCQQQEVGWLLACPLLCLQVHPCPMLGVHLPLCLSFLTPAMMTRLLSSGAKACACFMMTAWLRYVTLVSSGPGPRYAIQTLLLPHKSTSYYAYSYKPVYNDHMAWQVVPPRNSAVC